MAERVVEMAERVVEMAEGVIEMVSRVIEMAAGLFHGKKIFSPKPIIFGKPCPVFKKRLFLPRINLKQEVH
jgi:hypothetical protein